jgi:hypothetical protein
LAGGPKPRPSMAFRQRVLDDMASELRRSRRQQSWRLVASIAASFLLCVSVSLITAQATGFALRQSDSGPSVYEIAGRIQRLLPDISPEESLRRATLLEIAARAGHGTPLGDAVRAGDAESSEEAKP